MGTHFFEGAEKLLEVWLTSADETADLRVVSRKSWEELLELVHCQIISTKQDDDMIEFVLSESSMFISKSRFILKTCGQTTLLLAIKPLIKLVRETCGFELKDIFYSRKNFLRPDLQPAVHRNFVDEVEHLEEIVANGSAYTLGKMNGNCWYLYTVDQIGVVEPDQTLEVLMQELDTDVMKQFFKNASTQDSISDAPISIWQKCGVLDLLPDMIVDDHLFEPCGYSMNGVIPGGYYVTIHVTPEPQFSYVSFETNVPRDTYLNLVDRLLNVFRPGKFILTLFANKESRLTNDYKLFIEEETLPAYRRVDHQLMHLKNYNLTYTHYIAKTFAADGTTPIF